ncbi:MAG TPA: glycosyltransferase [Candidatus Paceibacterota bacterium]|nr:glycosyltransferase [Candidatus Paceibacterota bacterium]
MKICVLSTIDCRGGAAKVAWELRENLKKEGHQVATFVRYKYSDEADVFVIPRKRYQDWLVKIFANDLIFARSKYILKTKEFLEADIIHCHNLHSNFFDLALLKHMSKLKPVIWTMHDLWAITGYASDSVTRKNPNKKRFLLYLWDNTQNLLEKKSKIYRNSKLTIIAVSDWMKNEVQNSVLGMQKIIRIYNGIDTSVFTKKDKIKTRQKLGLPLDKKIVAFGTKGWHTVEKIIETTPKDSNLYFLSIGNSNVKTLYPHYKSTEHLTDKNRVAEYLGAADVLLYPTQGDSFGLTAAEAIACGTPVVAYAIDALPEIINHTKNGYLAIPDSQEDLKRGMEYFINLPQNQYAFLSSEMSTDIANRFSNKKMYEEYKKLYNEILSKKENPTSLK